jgi:hypothetical protein
MKIRNASLRAALLLGFVALPLGLIAVPAASASPGVGYVRLANLAENSKPVDLYLYPSGSTRPAAPTVADAGYGAVGTEMSETVGDYTIAVLPAGSSASSAAEYSGTVSVHAGQLYTVGPIDVSGTGSARKVLTLKEPTTTKAGQSTVTAINTAIGHGAITFHCSCAAGAPGNILTSAQTDAAYTAPIPPGDWTMTATGSGGVTASVYVPLAANANRTEIVLGTASGLEIVNLLDAVGDTAAVGGAGTGFGGSAPHGPGSPLPWLALAGAGVLLVAAGGLTLSRARTSRTGPGRQASRD